MNTLSQFKIGPFFYKGVRKNTLYPSAYKVRRSIRTKVPLNKLIHWIFCGWDISSGTGTGVRERQLVCSLVHHCRRDVTTDTQQEHNTYKKQKCWPNNWGSSSQKFQPRDLMDLVLVDSTNPQIVRRVIRQTLNISCSLRLIHERLGFPYF